MKMIQYRGKRLTVNNLLSIDRHSSRKKIVSTSEHSRVGLTREGERKALRKGRTLPKSFFLRGYYSPTPRSERTAKLLRKGFLKSGGRSGRKALPSLAMEIVFKDNAFIDEQIQKHGVQGTIMKWLNHELPESAVELPEKFAERIVKSFAWTLLTAGQLGVEGIHLNAIAHDFTVATLYQTLAGKDFSASSMRLPKFNEGLRLYYVKGSRIIMEYQGKKLDVTKKIEKILSKTS
ncbi:MAG TPA: hypothetical protein HA227_04110 [Candidatus Diapherotrites archaeon]|uniref:Uncharacterized protein n=1 Tax=Candidatus Iainarchaeum sp. TaxID=3101447 RepID=A0A7J4KUC7_9ARCH|nr:hypothetical protein [Candidatus Diapherotrites archaeon]